MLNEENYKWAKRISITSFSFSETIHHKLSLDDNLRNTYRLRSAYR